MGEVILEVEPTAEIVVFGDRSGSSWSIDEPGYREKDWDKPNLTGVKFRLDEPLEEAWSHIIQADVVLMSRSAFSYVPAMLSDAVVIAAPVDVPLGHEAPLSHWVVTQAPNPWVAAEDEDALLAEVQGAMSPSVLNRLRAKLEQKLSR